jgi:hypothetical protein
MATRRVTTYQLLVYLEVMRYARTRLLSVEIPEDEAEAVQDDKPRPQLALHGSYWYSDFD